MLLEGLLGAVVLVEESEVLHPELVELILELLQAGHFGVWLLSRCRHDLGWCTSAFPSIKYWILFIKSKARCCNTGGGDRRGGRVDVLAETGESLGDISWHLRASSPHPRSFMFASSDLQSITCDLTQPWRNTDSKSLTQNLRLIST